MLWTLKRDLIDYAPDSGAGGGETTPPATTETPPGNGGSEKTFTQAEVDQIIKDRLAREKKSAEALAEAARKAAEADAAAKNGEWQKLAETREAELKKASADLQAERIRATAARLGMSDPEYAVYLVTKAGDGADAEAVLKEHLSHNPPAQTTTTQTQAPTGSGDPTNPGTTPTAFTRAQLRDAKFFQANREAILKAAAEGRIKD